MSGEQIGEFQSERMATENTIARQIVSEILNFGVNDRIMLVIISSLAMNLENIEHMKAISKCVRSLNSDAFLLDRAEADANVGYVTGDDDVVVG